MKLTCYQCASCKSISDPQENNTLPEHWINVKFTSTDADIEADVCSRQCFCLYLGKEFDLKVE